MLGWKAAETSPVAKVKKRSEKIIYWKIDANLQILKSWKWEHYVTCENWRSDFQTCDEGENDVTNSINIQWHKDLVNTQNW